MLHVAPGRAGRMNHSAQLNGRHEELEPAFIFCFCAAAGHVPSFIPMFLLQLIASSQLLVRYNSTLFRLHSHHQAAVRLHHRVKVTIESCFAGVLQRQSPSHRLFESHLASAAPEQQTPQSVSAAIIGMLKNLCCSIDLC